MSALRNKLSHLISGQIPDYIRDTYPTFLLFIQYYYQFLEQTEGVTDVLLNSASWSDIDLSLDSFIPEFRKQFAWEIPETSLYDNRRLIKYINQYYEAKGSENATELFFRLMYNDTVSVVYPGDYILRASDGNWKRRKSLKLDATNFINALTAAGKSPFDLEGKIITLQYTIYVSGVGNVSYLKRTSCFGVVELSANEIYKH
jgi:hypothetical protein